MTEDRKEMDVSAQAKRQNLTFLHIFVLVLNGLGDTHPIGEADFLYSVY